MPDEKTITIGGVTFKVIVNPLLNPHTFALVVPGNAYRAAQAVVARNVGLTDTTPAPDDSA